MDSVFFWLSKLLWAVVAPDTLLLLLLLLAWLLQRRGARRAASRLLGVVVLTLTLVALFPVGKWMLAPLEHRFATNPILPAKVDGIIVLGGAESPYESHIWQQPELNDSAERLFAFLSLARRYPDARLLYTGGTGNPLDQRHKGASVAQALLAAQGLAGSRLMFERQSRNTYENAVLSHRLVQPQPGENWILITTAWHMPRSVGVFCKAGWAPVPYPVDHWTTPAPGFSVGPNLATNLRVLRYATKEWAGLAAYYLSGKTTAWFPDGCHPQT